jgi:hypothetical protein
MATPREIDVLALLGKPVTSAPVKAFLAATKIVVDYTGDGFSDDRLAPGNEASGAHLELIPASEYDDEHATRSSAKRPTEWVVREVDLHGKGTNTKKTRAYPGTLPFGLAFGDTGEVVVTKIGKKPSSRERGTSYAHAWWFRLGDKKLLAALDDKTRLLWLRVVPLGRDEAKAIARKRTGARARRG